MNGQDFFRLSRDVSEAAMHDSPDGERSRSLIEQHGPGLSFAEYASINRTRAAILRQIEQRQRESLK